MTFRQTTVFACLILFCALLTGTAGAYVIDFTITPPETPAGGVVTITGTSNIPAGYSDEAILYREVPNFFPKEAGRYRFTTSADGTWGFCIDTTGFPPATYKVQLPKSGEYPYGSSAVLMRTFDVTGTPQTSVPDTPIPESTQEDTTPPANPETLVIPPPTTSSAPAAAAVIGLGCCALAGVYTAGKREK